MVSSWSLIPDRTARNCTRVRFVCKLCVCFERAWKKENIFSTFYFSCADQFYDLVLQLLESAFDSIVRLDSIKMDQLTVK